MKIETFLGRKTTKLAVGVSISRVRGSIGRVGGATSRVGGRSVD